MGVDYVSEPNATAGSWGGTVEDEEGRGKDHPIRCPETSTVHKPSQLQGDTPPTKHVRHPSTPAITAK